jgi:hypothetical protein
MAKIIPPDDVTNPQVMQYLFTDPGDPVGIVRRITVYTGILNVNHFTGGDLTPLDIEYPLIGIFPVPGDEDTRGILPLRQLGPNPVFEDTEFRTATANVSISSFVDKTDVCIVSIQSVSVSLCSIVLERALLTQEPIGAVVLFMNIQGQNSEFRSVGYQVNVVEKLLPQFGPEPGSDPLDVALSRPFRPRLVNKPPFNWNGRYLISNGHVVVPGSVQINGQAQLFA